MVQGRRWNRMDSSRAQLAFTWFPGISWPKWKSVSNVQFYASIFKVWSHWQTRLSLQEVGRKVFQVFISVSFLSRSALKKTKKTKETLWSDIVVEEGERLLWSGRQWLTSPIWKEEDRLSRRLQWEAECWRVASTYRLVDVIGLLVLVFAALSGWTWSGPWRKDKHPTFYNHVCLKAPKNIPWVILSHRRIIGEAYWLMICQSKEDNFTLICRTTGEGTGKLEHRVRCTVQYTYWCHVLIVEFVVVVFFFWAEDRGGDAAWLKMNSYFCVWTAACFGVRTFRHFKTCHTFLFCFCFK